MIARSRFAWEHSILAGRRSEHAASGSPQSPLHLVTQVPAAGLAAVAAGVAAEHPLSVRGQRTGDRRGRARFSVLSHLPRPPAMGTARRLVGTRRAPALEA